jgi:hypothetical protein
LFPPLANFLSTKEKDPNSYPFFGLGLLQIRFVGVFLDAGPIISALFVCAIGKIKCDIVSRHASSQQNPLANIRLVLPVANPSRWAITQTPRWVSTQALLLYPNG